MDIIKTLLFHFFMFFCQEADQQSLVCIITNAPVINTNKTKIYHVLMYITDVFIVA